MRAGDDDRSRAPEKVLADGFGQRAVPDLPVEHLLELRVAARDRVADHDEVEIAGDVIGRETESQMATPVGAHDGKIAAHNALSGEPLHQVDHSVIPRTIFTDPQVAVVGLTDEEAVAAGIACDCNTIPLSVVPRAGAIRDTRVTNWLR